MLLYKATACDCVKYLSNYVNLYMYDIHTYNAFDAVF